MTPMKTILLTAAMMAVPAGAFAQSSATTAKDYAKDKAVDTVMDNVTAEDAIVAGTTMIKGGSKEDAAIAVVKNRVDGKLDGMTGGAVSMDDMSKDGMMDAATDMAKDKMMDKAEGHSSATSYGDKAAGAVKTMTDKTPSSAATYGSAVIPKSGTPKSGTGHSSATTYSAPAAATPVNCPAGTKGMPDGTCMVTGNWNPS